MKPEVGQTWRQKRHRDELTITAVYQDAVAVQFAPGATGALLIVDLLAYWTLKP